MSSCISTRARQWSSRSSVYRKEATVPYVVKCEKVQGITWPILMLTWSDGSVTTEPWSPLREDEVHFVMNRLAEMRCSG